MWQRVTHLGGDGFARCLGYIRVAVGVTGAVRDDLEIGLTGRVVVPHLGPRIGAAHAEDVVKLPVYVGDHYCDTDGRQVA